MTMNGKKMCPSSTVGYNPTKRVVRELDKGVKYIYRLTYTTHCLYAYSRHVKSIDKLFCFALFVADIPAVVCTELTHYTGFVNICILLYIHGM